MIRSLLGLWLFALALLSVHAQPNSALEQEFRDPPDSARPRVWWHWLNGNVTREGIRKDLEWMDRAGIGGVQTFDVNFATPQVVETRLAYMTPEWKDAFRYATELAGQHGLELTIAASPGWSETGGPWVEPRDGMKKLAWSETVIPGGRRFRAILPAPPSTTGSFQDLVVPEQFSVGAKKELPVHYADVAVLAWRAAAPEELPTPTIALGDGKTLDAAALADGSWATGIEVPSGRAEAPTIINLSFGRAQTIRSASLFIPYIADMFAAPSVEPRLEASSDGRTWRKVSDLALSLVPTTVSFAPVTASHFRVVLTPATDIPVYGSDAAPGYDIGMMAALFSPRPTMKILELRLSPEARVNQFEVKAGFAIARDYYALDADVADEEKGVAPAEVVDLRSRMKPDGTLDWTPPRGTWRVVRLGWSLTGKINHPAPDEATGLEVDKLDGAAVRRYAETYIGKYREVTGKELMGARGVNALLTDSTEVGAFNWTPRLPEQFRRLRGYDALAWLPALTGVIIGTRAESNKFLYDFRRTIADLHASEHYGTLAQVAHENGLKVYGEAQEGWRPSLGDDMDMRRYADVPMAAIWAFRREDAPKPIYFADMRGAASTAHLYGQNLAAAESLTSARQPWAHAPGDLRRIVDMEFASGINRVVIHTSVHQPVDDKQPGLSMRHIGQFFTRHETWAGMARPWMDYIARSCYLLQQGRFVADVAYFYGEEAPPGPQTGKTYFTDVPTRHAYDFVNPTAVHELLKVDAGDLVAPGGARYRLLYLAGTSERMTMSMLRRISELAEQGATILGEAPAGSPSLEDAAAKYAALVRKLWSGKEVTRIGKGRVISGKDVDAALRAIDVAPDFDYETLQADVSIPFVHRQLADGDIYFLSNPSSRPEHLEARFRVNGKAPEIWRADTGTSAPLSFRIEGGQTIVPLSFDPEDSFFVVFRVPAVANSRNVPDSTPEPVATLDGSWQVSFQAGRGAPASSTLPRLLPLNGHADPGIKYFSGVATYVKTFSVPDGYKAGDPLMLDLGSVGEIAEVHVNGQMIGTVWHAPFRIDIGSAVKGGDNRLEIRVANLWVNRLVGDAQPGAHKIAFTVMPTYRADAPLRPSGLIGPVQLMTTGAR